MGISCPHCQNAITLKTVKPGRFRLNCPKCSKPFVLAVAADLSLSASLPPAGGSSPSVSAVSGGGDPNATAPPPGSDPNVTAPPPASDPNSTAPPPAYDPSATAPLPAAAPAAGKARSAAASGIGGRTEATGGSKPPAAKKPAAPASGAKPAVGAKTAPSAAGAKSATKPAPGPAKKPSAPDATEALPAAKPKPAAPAADATGAFKPSAGAGEHTEALDSSGGSPGGAGEHTADFAAADPDSTAPPPDDDPDRTGAPQVTAKSKAGSRTGTPKKKLVGKALAADAPKALGGYEVLKQLGKGGMGTVYLARQVSLDRHVALKTMNPEWASDPRFLTRFTREAYAAAQLIHHNILQIYDIGEDKGTPFFSMEFVEGSNLGEVVEKEGKMDVETAVGYILQAARGLKYAHDQGMVHRDIKPDNLMLNLHGIVKVADLGLVKTPQAAAQEEAAEGGEAPEDSERTQVGVAMGTPSYMAPEQSLNAAGVDQRADIYSLGCTLYAMVTGRPPFQGKSAMEVMSKHQTEPIVRPEKIVKHVPPEISNVVLKMLAKKLEDRYQDLAEVIADLERFLGIKTTGPFSPQQEHVDALESAAKKFQEAPAAKIRTIVLPAFFGACLLAMIVCMLFGGISPIPMKLAVCSLGVGLFTGLFGFIACGLTNRSHVFQKARELVFGNTWSDWLTWLVALVLFIAVSWFVGLLHWWVGVFMLAAGLAAVYCFMIDRSIGTQRTEPLEEIEKFLKTLRLKGVDEEALQQFVCKYGGERWEELYEALFGYEALVQARQLWSRSATGRARPHFAPWREPVLRWIDARQKARKEAKERRHLAKVERKALEAQGMSASEARAIAEAAADNMVQQAEQLKAENRAIDSTVAPEGGRPVRVKMATALLAGGPAYAMRGGVRPPPRPKKPLKELLNNLLSPKVRFLTGAILVGLCLMWATMTNDLLKNVGEAVNELGNMETPSFFEGFSEKVKNAKPLFGADTPIAPIFNSFNLGIAGLLLIIGAMLSELRVIALFVAGALVILLAPLVPLGELPINPTLLWAIVGGVIVVLGFILGRFIK